MLTERALRVLAGQEVLGHVERRCWDRAGAGRDRGGGSRIAVGNAANLSDTSLTHTNVNNQLRTGDFWTELIIKGLHSVSCVCARAYKEPVSSQGMVHCNISEPKPR